MAEREPETHWVESLGFLKDGKGFLKKKNATVDGSEIGLITWDIKNS